MNTRNTKFLFVLLIFLSLSCSREQEEGIGSKLIEAIGNSGFTNAYNKQAVLILPKAGCTGCINSAETFVVDNAKVNRSFGVVLTDIVSLKTTKIKFGEDLIDQENIYIDHNNDFYKNGLESLYPTIFYLRNKRIGHVEFVSPENPEALFNLGNYINKDNNLDFSVR